MRLTFLAILVCSFIGAFGVVQADDNQQKPAEPRYSNTGRVEGLFVSSDKGRCRDLCRRAYRPGYELSNDICIEVCMNYPH